jgi:putative tryptophan/tyrosine transport system substrate-binding protein
LFDIRRREFITLLGGAAVAWPVAARAQQPERMRRIGVLVGLAESDSEQRLRIAAFLDGLREFGWIDGRNVRIAYRYSANDPDRRRAFAADLVALAPDVILANSTHVLPPLRDATRTIPIVFTMVADPLSLGLVGSLSRPGGNITGFATTEDATSGKLLQLLKEVDSNISRVLTISDRSDPSHEKRVLAIDAAAALSKVQSTNADAQSAAEIERAIDTFAKGSNSGVIVLPSSSSATHRDLITLMMARHRLPAIYAYRYFVTIGGLLSYGIDTIDLHRRAASYVDRILRGEKPGDLPVQQPTKFELVINLKAAKAIGIEFPATLIARADEVIE